MYRCIDGRVRAVERNNNTRREVFIAEHRTQNTEHRTEAGRQRARCMLVCPENPVLPRRRIIRPRPRCTQKTLQNRTTSHTERGWGI